MWIRYREERRPHPYEDKMRALELYLRYDRSAAAVINELSYPDRQTLRLRYRKLEVSKKTAFRHLTMGRPPTEVDCAARRKQPARPLHATSHPPSPIRAATPYPRPAITDSKQRPNARQQPQPSQQTAPRQAAPNRRHKPASNHEPTFVTSLEAAIIYHALKTTQTRLQPAVFRLYCNR